MLQYFLRGLDSKTQAALSLMFSKSLMMDEENRRREYAQMKREIEDDILSRITATVDVSEIIMQIDELKKAIDSLAK